MENGLILIVEDDADSRWIFRTVLAHAGYRVIDAENGREGLARLGETVPDLLVLDLMLPQIDGLELLERIRGHPDTSGLPVLAMSADPLREEAALAAGSDVFLAKPLRPQALLECVRSLLEGRAAAAGGSGPGARDCA